MSQAQIVPASAIDDVAIYVLSSTQPALPILCYQLTSPTSLERCAQ